MDPTIKYCFLSCKSQPADSLKQGLIIDPAIEQKVTRLYNKGDITEASRFDVEIFENDRQKSVTPLSGKSVPHYAVRNLNGDSLVIVFTNMTGVGFGMAITVTSDICKVQHVVSSRGDDRIFKTNPDSIYKRGLTVPGKFYLILNKRKPDSRDERTYGYVEYSSDEYYEKTEGGDVKRRVKYKGYFEVSGL